MRLVLASTSTARRAALTAAGVPHDVAVPDIDEREVAAALHDITPATLAATLAQKKALAIGGGPGVLVLGCDQLLETDAGAVLSKPVSIAEARDQLTALRGRTHHLISAAAIAEEGDVVWRGTETVAMRMRPFGDAFLDDYLAGEADHVLRCVGGYRIEAAGAQLFDAIEGSHWAILGLPLLPLLAYLRERGVLET